MDTQGRPSFTIEFACYRKGVIVSVDGGIESDPSVNYRMFKGGAVAQSGLDTRLSGDAVIYRAPIGARRGELRGDGRIAVEGQELKADGARVRIVSGGEILWY